MKLFSSFSGIIIVSLFLINNAAYAQSNPTSSESEHLFNEISQMDSLLFKVAFNECDLALWQTIMAEDFEFYDDRTGLNTSRDKEIRSFKDRCSKKLKVTRKLINTEIYPLNTYGAVQTGVHEFYVDGKRVEIAKFIHIWRKINSKWVITRVVSYDHKSIK